MIEPWPHRVAILFSGGNSPGMNALLRNLVRLGSNRHAAKVVGVKDGSYRPGQGRAADSLRAVDGG